MISLTQLRGEIDRLLAQHQPWVRSILADAGLNAIAARSALVTATMPTGPDQAKLPPKRGFHMAKLLNTVPATVSILLMSAIAHAQPVPTLSSACFTYEAAKSDFIAQYSELRQRLRAPRSPFIKPLDLADMLST
jgi:hypothetical protein